MNYDRYKKLFSVDFDFGNVARKVAVKVAGLNQGAREIAKIIGGLRKAIIVEKQKLADSFKDKEFKVFYSPNGDKFVLRERIGEIDSDEDIFESDAETLNEMTNQKEMEPETIDENNSEFEEQAEDEENEITNLESTENLTEGKKIVENISENKQEILEEETEVEEAKG